MTDLTAAFRAAKEAINGLFDGECVITGYTGIKNPATKETELRPETVYSGRCRLSKPAKRADQTESASEIDFDALIFLPAEAPVKAGCKITVTQNGATTAFEQAGEPSAYATHKEVRVRRATKA